MTSEKQRGFKNVNASQTHSHIQYTHDAKKCQKYTKLLMTKGHFVLDG